MSTTIDACRRGLRFVGLAFGVLAAWFALAALATLVLEPTRAVAVFAPASSSLPALVHANARILDAGAGFVVVQGEHKGFVRQLYAGGGWLVLPAMTGGCRSGGRDRATIPGM